LGYETGIVARIGPEDSAREVLSQIESHGVDCSAVHISDEDETTFTQIYNEKGNGQLVFAGGNSVLRQELKETDKKYLSTADHIHTSGYASSSLLNEIIEVKPTDATLSFDLAATFEELSSRGYSRSQIDTALPAIDLFISQESALRSYRQTNSTEQAIEELFESRVPRVAVTKGETGGVLATPEETVTVSSFDIDAVDTTGAGDAFAAGLIHTWLYEQETMPEAGRVAAAMAALNCRNLGGQAALPTREELQAFLQANLNQ
jgi:sugar/nucleoside kinase (ribokinase family)